MNSNDDLAHRARELFRTRHEELSRTLGGAAVGRVLLEVRVGGHSEWVTLSYDEGQLHVTCSAPAEQGRYIDAALSWFVMQQGAPTYEAAPQELQRASISSVLSRVVSGESTRYGRHEHLADALRDLVTAVVRAGAGADASPSVQEQLQHVIACLPDPAPAGISRWIGRLRAAVAPFDADHVAWLLDGALTLVDALSDTRSGVRDAAQRMRTVSSWLGYADTHSDTYERVQDQVLLEVGREWVSGVQRSSIERRYLADLTTDEVLCEERVRGGRSVSVGPCPRVLSVGLAHAQRGLHPRRIRLYQYSVGIEPTASQWSRVASAAISRFEVLPSLFRRALDSDGALAEPFVLLAPHRFTHHRDVPVPVDTRGLILPITLTDDAGKAGALSTLVKQGHVMWLGGRLVDVHGSLMLSPVSARVVRDGVQSMFSF